MKLSPSLPITRLGVTMLLLVAGRVAAGDHDTTRQGQRAAADPIVINDANGGAVSDVPPNPNSQTVDVAVGPNSSFTFSPSTVTILVGDTVRWTFLSNNHMVTSGSPCSVDNKYCSPSDTTCNNAPTSNINATYSHTFSQAGTFPYFCRVHCTFGMTGTVKVIAPSISSVTHAANGHFIITGTSVPNSTATIMSAPDLLTMFANPQTVPTDANGAFQFDDASVVGTAMQFYQVSFP